jgi:DNA-binding IclR family transcriptional regulator
MMQFTAAVRRQRDVSSVALPHMEAIARTTRETVLLTRRSNQYAVCIERVEGSHAVRISFDRGHIQPLHAGASSKILLAYVAEETLVDCLILPLHAYTEATVTDLDLLRQQLAQIRAQRFCVTKGEVDDGAIAAAVPILDSRGQLVAGLSTAGPSFRMSDAVIAEHLRLLREAAATISDQLIRAGL